MVFYQFPVSPPPDPLPRHHLRRRSASPSPKHHRNSPVSWEGDGSQQVDPPRLVHGGLGGPDARLRGGPGETLSPGAAAPPTPPNLIFFKSLYQGLHAPKTFLYFVELADVSSINEHPYPPQTRTLPSPPLTAGGMCAPAVR